MYVIFDSVTTKLVRLMRDGYWQDAKYKTEAAAKAGLTRLKDRNTSLGGQDLSNATIDTVENFDKVEKYEVVTNLMSGLPVRQRVNTPRSCDPSTETYWSL